MSRRTYTSLDAALADHHAGPVGNAARDDLPEPEDKRDVRAMRGQRSISAVESASGAVRTKLRDETRATDAYAPSRSRADFASEVTKGGREIAVVDPRTHKYSRRFERESLRRQRRDAMGLSPDSDGGDYAPSSDRGDVYLRYLGGDVDGTNEEG